ncbi:MAG: hypothetical protein HYU97_07885 [Deltaproteobacteria bacterium]|nr:hypothetical protein [Deltaproteobacteria bacterium]
MNLPANLLKLQKFHQNQSGVFTLSDLKNLIEYKSILHFQRQIQALEDHKILFQFMRGFYVMPPFELEVLSQRICEKSYISMANVLAKNLLIGTVPHHTVYAVKVGKRRVYEHPLGTIIHLGIAPHLFFGYEVKTGIRYANKEKAFLDTLYFYQKGFKPYFNIYQDIFIKKLDKKIIYRYLQKYKNPRFIKFVKGVFHGGN